MKTSMGLGLSVVLMWLTPLVEASERFERSLMITSRAALERDGAAQLGELVLEPEINLRFTDNVSVTAITRTRLDLANRLEPGQPSNRNRSQPSSRVFWGDETDTELRELFADLTLGASYLRIGKQQVVWGEADGLKVLDQVNPQSFREFILADFEDSRIPLWMVNAEIPVGRAHSLQLLWIPDTTYHDVPEADAKFAFSSSRLVPTLPAGVPIASITRERPSDLVKDSDVGMRLSSFLGGWQLSFNYLYHYFDQAVVRRDLTAAGVALSSSYERTHLVGGTFNYATGDFVLRGEAGYSSDRYFLSDRPGDRDGVVRSAEFGTVLGVDWSGLTNTLISAQLFQSSAFDHGRAMTRDRHERSASLLFRRDLRNQTITTELLWIHSISDGDGVAQVQVRYAIRSQIELFAGMDVFYGSSNGLFGQFDARDRLTFGIEVGL